MPANRRHAQATTEATRDSPTESVVAMNTEYTSQETNPAPQSVVSQGVSQVLDRFLTGTKYVSFATPPGRVETIPMKDVPVPLNTAISALAATKETRGSTPLNSQVATR